MSTLNLSVAQNCADVYAAHLEEFAKSLGVTEENAHEYTLKSCLAFPEVTELWHNDRPIGVVVTKFVNEDNSLRFVVETKKLHL